MTPTLEDLLAEAEGLFVAHAARFLIEAHKSA